MDKQQFIETLDSKVNLPLAARDTLQHALSEGDYTHMASSEITPGEDHGVIDAIAIRDGYCFVGITVFDDGAELFAYPLPHQNVIMASVREKTARVLLRGDGTHFEFKVSHPSQDSESALRLVATISQKGKQ